MFISIHIPKTAGTSLGEVFDKNSGRKVFWDYDPSYRFALNIQPEIVAGLPFIRSYYQFIHGHFFYLKYADVIPGAKFITCVRHPIDRAVSQYYHIAYDPDVKEWQAEFIRRGEMGFVDYVKSDPNIASAMSKHLEGIRPEDLDFVFVTESLQRDLDMFSRKFNFKISTPVPTHNTGEHRKDFALTSGLGTSVLQVTEEDKQRAYGLCSEDVELYIKCQGLKG